MVLLNIENLTVKYPSRRGEFTAIENVSLHVNKGEILGVVGESGAGKSTIGNAVMGVLQHPGYMANGSVYLAGEHLQTADENRMQNIRGKRIGMIFQDPMTALNPLLTIEKQLVETICRHLPLSKQQARQKAIDLLAEMEIPDPNNRISYYPHQLSGGQRQRIVIALALCAEPEVIIADEPTTALDVSVQSQILKLLRKLTVQRGVGILLITHNMGVIKDVTDRVAVMFKGKLVEIGKTENVLNTPTQEYTKALISAVPPCDRRIERFVNVDSIEKNLDLGVAPDWLISDMHPPQTKSTNTDILQVQNVDLRFLTRGSIIPKFRAYFQCLKNISFTVKDGETMGIVGESGSGKSSIARVICGLYGADNGQILYKDTVLNTSSRKGVGREVQMIFQSPYASLDSRWCVQNIIGKPMQLHFPDLSKQDIKNRVQDLLKLVGLPAESAVKYPHEFSGGQQQRISIARALGMKPRFLICDEPTSALDVSVQAQILNLLKDLQAHLGLTMIFISHDLSVIRQMCACVMVMQNGRVLENQETEKLFKTPKTSYTKQLLDLMPGQQRITA